jgi:hypothetical protein
LGAHERAELDKRLAQRNDALAEQARKALSHEENLPAAAGAAEGDKDTTSPIPPKTGKKAESHHPIAMGRAGFLLMEAMSKEQEEEWISKRPQKFSSIPPVQEQPSAAPKPEATPRAVPFMLPSPPPQETKSLVSMWQSRPGTAASGLKINIPADSLVPVSAMATPNALVSAGNSAAGAVIPRPGSGSVGAVRPAFAAGTGHTQNSVWAFDARMPVLGTFEVTVRQIAAEHDGFFYGNMKLKQPRLKCAMEGPAPPAKGEAADARGAHPTAADGSKAKRKSAPSAAVAASLISLAALEVQLAPSTADDPTSLHAGTKRVNYRPELSTTLSSASARSGNLTSSAMSTRMGAPVALPGKKPNGAETADQTASTSTKRSWLRRNLAEEAEKERKQAEISWLQHARIEVQARFIPTLED